MDGWEWLEEADEADCDTESEQSDFDENTENDDTSTEVNEEEIPSITHSVTFKCIGSTKELRYQEVLALAKQKIKKEETVEVKLQKEPDNPVDANAIAFMCNADSKWERIGYVVSEALLDAHDAINNKKIINVYFDWIRYIVYFKNPGWYTGIIVTRSSNWSNTMMLCSSKKFLINYHVLLQYVCSWLGG